MTATPRRLQALVAIAAVAALAALVVRARDAELPAIGPATTITELTSGATLAARIDTGASLCSIHCDAIHPPELADPVDGDHKPTDDARDSVGRPIRFRIRDDAGEPHWIETRLADVSVIRVGNVPSLRYCVSLPVRVAGVEATVLVSLNNRSEMKYPFLVGRNFLEDRFVVDVRTDNDDAIF